MATTTNGRCEGEGYFTLKGKNIKGYFGNQIPAPSDFVCKQLNASLETAKIPISGGAFDYRGKAKIGYGLSPLGPFKRMSIRFKGSWKSASSSRARRGSAARTVVASVTAARSSGR